jgi:hypothetical protein
MTGPKLFRMSLITLQTHPTCLREGKGGIDDIAHSPNMPEGREGGRTEIGGRREGGREGWKGVEWEGGSKRGGKEWNGREGGRGRKGEGGKEGTGSERDKSLGFIGLQ